jgi:predicted CoA-binding protein
MPRARSNRARINEFLIAGTFAVIGVSADRKKFGNALYRGMKEKGLSVVPVHRKLARVEGDLCYHSVAELKGKVDAVITVVPPVETDQVVQESLAAGIRKIWMQQGSESERAYQMAAGAGACVIRGECLFMFLEPVRSAHALHRWLWKALGRYPRA